MHITERLCAFLALAQLLRNFVFFSFAGFPLILLHCITFVFHFAEEKSPLAFLHFWRIFFPPVLSQFCELQKTLCQLNFVVLYAGESKTELIQIRNQQIFIFQGFRSLFVSCIVLAFTQHVSKTYKNAFVVLRFGFDLQL